MFIHPRFASELQDGRADREVVEVGPGREDGPGLPVLVRAASRDCDGMRGEDRVVAILIEGVRRHVTIAAPREGHPELREVIDYPLLQG